MVLKVVGSIPVRCAVRIVPFAALAGESGVMEAVDDIFFSASARQDFDSDEQRSDFRERWLGRYLGADLAHGFLAVELQAVAPQAVEPRAVEPDAVGSLSDDSPPPPIIAGYLVGCLHNPARNSRFADIGYFTDFAALCRLYPAHLHINLQASYRNRGIGAELIGAFAAHAGNRGAAGMHVVTSPLSRAAGFYRRQGFLELARAGSAEHEVAFFGRPLG